MSGIVGYIVSPLKTLQTLIFNVKEKCYHRISRDEIATIKNTKLFSNMTEIDFLELLKSIKLVRYTANRIILREGEIGNELYIIAEGSVRVFTQDMNGVKIPLKTLVKGDYFGEQAIIGKTNKNRNSNIEAITDTTLICIDGTHFAQSLKENHTLKSKMESEKYQQAVNIISATSGSENNIESILTTIKKPNILEYRNNEYIFKVGDKPDNVYVVLQGKVKILIPDKNTGAFTMRLLNRGQIFGELGVIKNELRSATAIAHSNLRVLAIESSNFIRKVSTNTDVLQMVSSMQQIYELPLRGSVEQYAGEVPGMGTAIMNVYKLDDGRIIQSSKALKQDIFSMFVTNKPHESRYKYSHKNGSNNIELEVSDHHLIGIKAYGQWKVLPDICRALLDDEKIEDTTLEKFQLTGVLKNGN